MTVQAAMMYLRVLREARKLSQSDVARVAGVESKQVYRWERGESEPSASGIAAFVEAVQGSIEDVKRLILSSDATEDAGRQLAEALISGTDQTPDEYEIRRRRAIVLIDELLADPRKLDEWVDFGEWLRGRGEKP